MLLSLNYNDAVARDKIRDFYDQLSSAGSNNDVEAEQEVVTFKKILLQETLLLAEEQDYIKLQVDSQEVSLLANSAAYEHGATIGLAIIIGYLISALTQIYKNPDRFLKRDFDDRIELAKLKLKR